MTAHLGCSFGVLGVITDSPIARSLSRSTCSFLFTLSWACLSFTVQSLGGLWLNGIALEFKYLASYYRIVPAVVAARASIMHNFMVFVIELTSIDFKNIIKL